MKSLDSNTPNQDWHPNIWPPFTQINTSKPQIEVTHGKDALLFTKDPKKDLIVIFLTNRVYPTRESDMFYELDVREKLLDLTL